MVNQPLEVEQSSLSSFTSYQYPLLRSPSLRSRDSAKLAAAVGIALENIGSHAQGPTKASLKVAVRTSLIHNNQRQAPSKQVSSILMTCRKSISWLVCVSALHYTQRSGLKSDSWLKLGNTLFTELTLMQVG